MPPSADAHTAVIPAKEVVAKGPEKKGTTKGTNVHDDGLSPSVMKASATEPRRHRGKAFALLRVSVPPWQFSFTAKSTNIHDDDWSPSVMKALATESRRHGGKAFFSSPCLCASVAIFFHGKGKALLCALRVLCGSNSNLSTCINPDVYGAFKLKSVPLVFNPLLRKACRYYDKTCLYKRSDLESPFTKGFRVVALSKPGNKTELSIFAVKIPELKAQAVALYRTRNFRINKKLRLIAVPEPGSRNRPVCSTSVPHSS